MIKKLTGAALGLGMLLVSAMPAFAAVQCGNQTTGALSNNVCTRSLVKTKTLSLINRGTVLHNVNGSSVSGDNHSDYNTEGGLVNAGGADVLSESAASLNTASVTATQSDMDMDGDVTGVNDTTGYSSNNVVSIQTVKAIAVGINNNGTVTHNVNSTARSGNNTASFNTVGGSVTTGNATVTTGVTSILNDTIVDISQ